MGNELGHDLPNLVYQSCSKRVQRRAHSSLKARTEPTKHCATYSSSRRQEPFGEWWVGTSKLLSDLADVGDLLAVITFAVREIQDFSAIGRWAS